MAKQFYQLFKKYRMEKGTVRQFAKENDYDIAYISRLENGVTMPPKDAKKLKKLALALGLVECSSEWQEFMDLASMAKNELPEDFKDDERVSAMLPAFYRTLRNEKLDKAEAEKLIKLIKESGKEE